MRTIVILILGILVAAGGIIFAFSTFGKSDENAGTFWDLSGKIGKDTSVAAGDQPPSIKSCTDLGGKCFGRNTDCCSGLVCRPTSPGAELSCVGCGNGTFNVASGTESGDFCERNDDCCTKKDSIISQTCNNPGTASAYCCCY